MPLYTRPAFAQSRLFVVHSGEGDGWDMNRPTMGSILLFQGRLSRGRGSEHRLCIDGTGYRRQ